MNKTDYNREMETQMDTFPAGTPLLLHACCAPCASQAIHRLGGHFALTVYYDNPNIWPQAEYEARRAAFGPLLQQAPAAHPLRFLEGAYEPAFFETLAEGLAGQPEGGARCTLCFSLRLGRAAKQAAELGMPVFTTALTVGPRKNAAPICEIGAALGQEQGVHFLPADFKKKGGYQDSILLSRAYGLYRQHYCGCRYSVPPGSEDGAPPAGK